MVSVNLSVQIMAVPERLEALAPVLQAIPSAQVYCDYDHKGPWTTARACWLQGVASLASHVLVLHDDVELCDDFMRHAWNAAATHPFEPLSLFCSSPETVQAWDRGYSWLSWADKAWGAALILPARLAKEFVEWCDSHVNEAWKADDTRLALFLAARDRRLLTSVPSLVRHREGPSIAQPQGSTIPTALWLREPARRHGEMRWNGPVQYLDGNPRALLVSRGKWLKGL